MPSTPYDLHLQDTASSPTTQVDLVLLRNEDGLPWWTEERQPSFTPAQPQGAIEYASKDPRFDLVWSQASWHDGGLAPLYKANDPNRYAEADGCDLRWEGFAALGMEHSQDFSIGIRNANAETNSVTGWTVGGGGALTNVTTNPYSGSRHYRLTAGVAYQTLANFASWSGIASMNFGGYIKTGAGVSARFLISSDPAGEVITYSGTVAANSAYTFAAVVSPQLLPVSYIRIGIEVTGTGTVDFDNLFIRTPTAAEGNVFVGMAELAGVWYAACGPFILQWDETNDKWDVVYYRANTKTTSIVEFNGNIYVAYGGGDNAYVYGSGTTWTVSNATGDEKNAHFFAVSRGQLWKSRFDTTNSTHYHLNFCTNGVNGSDDWKADGSEYIVGSSERLITGLHSFQDVIFVGKEDGLHVYNRVVNDWATADTFQNVTNEMRLMPDTENFQHGEEHKGRLFLGASQQALFYYDGYRIIDISGLVAAPRLSTYGGRIRAITSDPAQLYILMDTPTADTTIGKSVRLLSIRELGGRLVPHVLDSAVIGAIDVLAVNRSSGAGYLWAAGTRQAGTLGAAPSVFRWTLPVKNVAPALDLTPAIPLSGTFTTSYYDKGMPDEQVALSYIQMGTESLDAEHTIKVEFEWDYSGSWTTWGTTSSTAKVQTFNASDITTPTTNAIGRVLRLRFTLATDDTVSPKLYWFAVHMVLRPTRVRVWTARFLVGHNVMGRSGFPVPVSKTDLLTDLGTLESQVYPITMQEDFDGDDAWSTGIRVQIVEDSLRRIPQEETSVAAGTEIWEMQMREVLHA